ncbi:tetratricopeptide repeat protein [Plastoroseomonas arctica]|uniref:Tetratricopeptide repeat protein n=1 Tax=Plastoroseomonas arctica TaxID=1509237 RepID=A0AAF1JZN1_9PROT|nr:tetratricopeptide repeat protein [Plastoroseomonas arctica]MBR0655943.1 tetratricopeptide repeat protein [Plastoroseomonas arctica]
MAVTAATSPLIAARAAIRAGRPAEALAVLDTPWFLRSPTAEVLLLRADALRALDHPGAEAAYQKVLAVTPREASAMMGLGAIARGRGDTKAAIAAFESAHAAVPRNLRPLDALMREYRDARRWSEAEAKADAALAFTPGHLLALMVKGQAARARGDSAGAIAAFQAAHAAAPTDLKALDQLMRECRDAQLWDAAEAAADAALGIAPDHLLALLMKGHAARGRGELDAATAAYEAAHQAAPGELRPLDMLIREHREAERWEELEVVATAALAIAPEHSAALLALAHMHRRRGALPEAIAVLRPIADTGAARLEFAQMLLDLGEDEARAEARRLLQSHPDQRRARRLLGRAALDRGAFAEARADFESVDDPDLATILALALLAWREGRPEDAQVQIAAAEAMAPDDPRPLELQARLARDAERHADAVDLFRAALARNPSSADSLLGLPAVLASTGAFDEAAAATDQAEAILGPGPRIALLRATALRRRGHWPEALEVARAACVGEEPPLNLIIERTRLELMLAGPEAATAALDTARPNTPKDRCDILLHRALILEERWDYDAAAALFAEGAALVPRHAELRLNAARNALIRLDAEGAREHLGATMEVRAAPRRQAGRSSNISQTHAGQILDEISLDPPFLADLQRIRRLPPAERIGPLGEEIRGNPESTAAAMQLLLAHRAAGPLDQPKLVDGAVIPFRICQFWTDADPPPDVLALMATWARHHPGAAVTRYDDATARAFLARFHPMVTRAFDAAHEPAMRADLFRLAWLYAEGGIYADADDRCHASIAPLLRPGLTLAFYLEPWATIGNNFMAAASGQSIIAEALRQAATAVLRGDRDLVWLSTGPGMMSRCLAAAMVAAGGPPPGVAIFDRPVLHQRVAMHCFLPYKSGNRHWSQAAFRKGARDAAVASPTAFAEEAPALTTE